MPDRFIFDFSFLKGRPASGEHFSESKLSWILIFAGLSAMYVPTFLGLFQTIWSTDQQGHGPIVLLVSLWLLWQRWPKESETSLYAPSPALGWPALLISSLIYMVGRSQGIFIFDVGSLPLMIISLTLIFRGVAHLKKIWFALFFMIFMIPLPGTLVDALTQPMKMAVSFMVEQLLNAAGYPIARNGVILQIGPYQLMVADACAGLHTLFTLEALGLFYINIVTTPSAFRNIAMALLIIPISFSANVIRVLVLVLITYYMGDAAGQGFLHGFAGIVLFIAALTLIIGSDALVRSIRNLFFRARRVSP